MCRAFIRSSRADIAVEEEVAFASIDSLGKVDLMNAMQMQVCGISSPSCNIHNRCQAVRVPCGDCNLRDLKVKALSVQVLQKFLQYNRDVIDFWLQRCIYPYETKILAENLRRTAWHMAETTSGRACF